MPEESEDEYKSTVVLQECVKEMKDCVDNARKCYVEELNLSDDHMLEMIFLHIMTYSCFTKEKCEVEKIATCGDGEGGNGKAVESLYLNIWKIDIL
ncbi:hypothetical protein RHGRI_005367 [Rhododendron griersonianum]|uniref:Uncharacterized protein n=1 Tax=Rhododendron griersonianum TaxID=479676 RepID=A0AAV6LEU4_9ERIC|nr:hypothetical protein RHGRI_005367 [Rhododendron griersonianum]